jgi:Holliday junction resolvase RusA-like endonuclease
VIEFFLPCVPPTANHQNKRITTIRARDGRSFHKLGDEPELVKAKQMIDGLLVPYRPPTPLTGPLTLTLEFTWPWRASDSQRTRARRLIPRTSRPDCSNLAKTTEDRLAQLLFMPDDAFVVELVVRKFFGDHPGIGIRIESCLDPVQTVLPPMAVTEPRERELFQEAHK